MLSEHATLYRGILRELRKSAIAPRKTNQTVKNNFRSLLTKYQQSQDPAVLRDLDHALLFLRSQRIHKDLVERYNPMVDFSTQDRVKATARRVGLDMPITPKPEEEERFMSPSATTRVLICEPSAIHFGSIDDAPEINDSETLNALKIASHHLVDLLEPVAFPTETVYGLGGAALSAEGSGRIFETKGRPADNPLIVHVSSLSMLNSILPKGYVMPKTYEALVKHFWPGPLTLLFPRDATIIPSIISAGQPSVAIRMPSHPVARALIAIGNVPLAAPSANSSGKPSPTKADHVFRDLNGKINVILDGGPCSVGLESTVVDGLQADGKIRILRPGGVTVEDIQRVLKEEFGEGEPIPEVLVHRRDYQDEAMEAAPTTPGMKYRHYSPSVPVTLLLRSSQPRNGEHTPSASSYLSSLKDTSPRKIGIMAPLDSSLWAHLPQVEALEWVPYHLGPEAEPALTAQRLFNGLLSLESDGVDQILIEGISEDREGLAVMNRVRKAAGEVQHISL